ncbi:MAG: formate dehydrogenase accessory sulfurtransferase FdhD [Deltaproteobacteria bacterium]|nr:formate dehydrogenase accessory sulfurtransferase FdhD [Deltaproteobacteria bacterium]MBW2660653.1 formate dehydrogenase accessory sulfurtransferase FdhD [Deltaproteobacteria bacterium]
MNTFSNHQIIFIDGKTSISLHHKLVGERPLSIYVQEKLYSITMRTPGDELPHAAGFCLGEGIIEKPDDFTSLSFCEKTNTSGVIITLTKSRINRISHLLDKQSNRPTHCLSGREMINNLYQNVHPFKNETRINIKMALGCLEKLSDHQPLRHHTHASHAAALYSSDYNLLSVAEDVGRHNAIDKTIGKSFLDRTLNKASFLILSSRISYELVQKAARAHIPIILAISRPTSLAVELASQLNMTLACLAKNSGLYIFCGANRVKNRSI